MKKTKLTRLFSSFTAAEFKRFKNFLNSPYFNNKVQLVNIFEYIVNYHPNYDNELLTEENAFNYAYPEKKYSYVLFKNLLSDLYELAKNFLAAEELGRNKLVLKNLCMHSLFSKFEIKDLVEKEIKLTEQFYESERMNEGYFDNYYQFKKDAAKYTSHVNQYENFDEGLNEEIDSFISMGLNNLLIYALCFETYNTTHQNTDYTDSLHRLIELYYSADKIKMPVNAVLYKVLKLMKTDDEKIFYEIMEMLKEEDKFLNMESKLWVYQPLEAFLVKRVRNGEKEFYKYQFELYKHCFESGLYDNEEYFAEGKLLAAVETAIRIGEFEWMENTVSKYINKVSESTRADYYNFCMAKIVQGKGENEKALDMLNKVNLDTGPLKSMARNMLMKIYFELGYFEMAKAQIDTYRHFISREKELSETYKESVNNFLRFYNKLIDLKIDRDVRKLDDFEYEAGKSKNVILKQWLIEKIDELKIKK